MNQIDKLTEIFSHFPGIGPKQSKRFVYYLLTRNGGYLKEIAEAILSLKEEVTLCESCFRFFPSPKSENLCKICRDKNRSKEQLLLVCRDVDMEPIEKSGIYDGFYFILGGSVPILEKEPENRIRLKELTSLLNKRGEIKEIIFAMNMNPEGEHTQEFVTQKIKALVADKKIKLSTLGRGLSTGTELEYSDSETIKNALKNRQ